MGVLCYNSHVDWIEGKCESIRFSVFREQEVQKCSISQVMDCTREYRIGVTLISYGTFFFLCVSAIIFSIIPPSFASQTRDQCEKCCRSSTQDEYYSEQCRLKCFRNPDHCVDQKSKQDAREEVAPPSGATPGPAPGRESVIRVGPPPSMPPRTSGPPPTVPGPVGPPPGRPGTVAPPAAGQRPRYNLSPAPPGGLSPRQAAQQGLLVFPSP